MTAGPRVNFAPGVPMGRQIDGNTFGVGTL
jgi:hypothetical protein